MYKSFNVKTLGILEINYSKNVFPEQGKRSRQVELLIIYLILNRDKNITSKQLISYLWSDKENQVTIGALRNLVYRARKDLKKLYAKESCILSKGHSYFWNPAVKCQVDYEEIVELSEKILSDNDTDSQYRNCCLLVDRFENPFLPEFQDNEWIAQLNKKLLKNCFDAVFLTIDKLENEGRFQEILELIDHPHLSEIENEVLFFKKMNAYYQSKQTDRALAYYQKLINNYYLFYGIETASQIKELYQKCLDERPELQLDTISIEDFLESSETLKGAFYCEFYVFKRIYQLNLSNIKHSDYQRALVMLTLDNLENGNEEDSGISEESQRLKNIMQLYLRKSDIFSQYSTTQYFLIIQAPKMSGIEAAVDRIIRYFDKEKTHSNISINKKIKKID